MKKSILIILFFSLITGIYAQENSAGPTPDPRLVDAFGQATIDHYLQNTPETIEYYNFFLNYSYTLEEFPKEKMSEYTQVEEFKLKEQYAGEIPNYSQPNLAKLNILKYDFNIDRIGGAIYRLGDSGILIVFRPTIEFIDMYNQHLKK